MRTRLVRAAPPSRVITTPPTQALPAQNELVIELAAVNNSPNDTHTHADFWIDLSPNLAFDDGTQSRTFTIRVPERPTINFHRISTALCPVAGVPTASKISECILRPNAFRGSQRKLSFVSAHLVAAAAIANELDIMPAEILGLSALESTWGTSSITKKGENYFGQQAPQPFEIGTFFSDGGTSMARFADYINSIRSWSKNYGHLIRGASNPGVFAKKLQDSGAFGIYTSGPKKGKPVPGYVAGVAGTIDGIANGISCH